jgi:mRNA export factor
MLDLNTNQTVQVGAHDAPIKSCRYIDGLPNMNNMLVTGSWDKTVRYWDLRSPTPAHTLQLPERCYTIDVKGPLMVIGCAERHILIFNLNNPSTPYKVLEIDPRLYNRL